MVGGGVGLLVGRVGERLPGPVCSVMAGARGVRAACRSTSTCHGTYRTQKPR